MKVTTISAFDSSCIKTNAAALKDHITEKVDNLGGVEKFNKHECANEMLLNWLYETLDIMDSMIRK